VLYDSVANLASEGLKGWERVEDNSPYNLNKDRCGKNNSL